MMLRQFLVCTFALSAFGQATPNDTSQRMEIMLERLETGSWHVIDPGLVLEQSDRVRFRFRTNFNGYLYVINQSTSGKYEQLFPRSETGQENRIRAGVEYRVPATDSLFRIAGPAGHEIVYWLVSPAPLTDESSRAPAGRPTTSPTLVPRCDDVILRSRGDCIDTSAGPRLVPRDADLPHNLAGAAGQSQPDLLFLRQKDTAVIASPETFSAPVIYEFHVAHR
ncbi:MAG: hypothetical protein C5B51_29490 [Terriglobia bacterium]|nr:MAG: hypothetical protein C5B51_29490 [Terriglobia bacterium]